MAFVGMPTRQRRLAVHFGQASCNPPVIEEPLHHQPDGINDLRICGLIWTCVITDTSPLSDKGEEGFRNVGVIWFGEERN